MRPYSRLESRFHDGHSQGDEGEYEQRDSVAGRAEKNSGYRTAPEAKPTVKGNLQEATGGDNAAEHAQFDWHADTGEKAISTKPCVRKSR
jgi:hypothetical protein